MENMGKMDYMGIEVEIFAMKQFTTGDLNKQIGDVTDAASREPVMLTRHKKPRFVLMSYDHYERMRTGGDPRRAYHISEMPAEHAELFDEALDRLARGEGYDDEP
ncbi:prevent-host-death family protein [Rhizobium ruizarguesonis]